MRSRSLVSLLAVAACGSKPPPPAPSPTASAPAPAAQAPAPLAAATPDLATRRKQLADLIEERWQYQLKTHPEMASILGDHRYDDRWADHSPEGFAAENAEQKEMLARFSAVDTTGFPEQEALNKELIVRILQQSVDTMKFEAWLMPVTQISGVHLWLPELVSMLRFESVEDYEHYLARLHAIPKVFERTIALMKLGATKHLMPPKILLDKVVPQARGLGTGKLTDNPFAQPVAKFPAAIAKADQDRLRTAILAAVKDEVQPAYTSFATYLEKDYVPQGRSEPGEWALPDGDARYAADVKQSTTTELTPEQIHQTGLAEVTRIEGEEAKLATKLGFESLDELRKHVRGDKKLYAKSRADILARYEKYTAQMYEKLPSLFGRLPKQHMQVKEVESFREKTAGAAEYNQGTPDGSRPGVVRVNTSDPTKRLTLDMESTAYHEGIPGHHLQLTIQQELGDMPEFRKHVNYTAYTEGWALYAERLGEEVGFYQDPWSMYGHYEDEMLRAIRLVVDTGFHYKRWTRDQVVRFFHDHSAIDEVNVQSETDRYIAQPAQALGYKVGQLTILRLRSEAQEALGTRFDIRAFHDEILGSGALPMDLLERRIHAWIERTKTTAFPAAAQDVPATLLQELHWRSIGPSRGGRVLAVAGVPREPAHFYFGAVNGGVWETTDAGRTWRPIFDSQPIGSIGALALAPSNPKVIYVGTGEADMRSDIAQGDGVYRSADGGRTWAHVGLADSQQIGRILVDPTSPDRVLVAALGHPYAANAERGVFRTEDGGKSWQRALHTDDDTGAIDLAFKPDDPRVVWAAMWRTRRPPWNVYPPANGPGSGLYRSNDGGRTFAKVAGHGLPDDPGRIGLAIAPSAPRRVYAMIDAARGGLYRSDDDGATWSRASDDPRIWGRGWYFGGITVDPRHPDVIYACNTSMYRSTDGGHSFAPVKGAPGGDDYHELWIDPERPERRILGVDQGAVVSLNGGETWSSWHNQPTAQIYRLATDNRFPYWVYGSQQDSGAVAVPSRTYLTRDGINMTHFHEITAGGENDMIAPDPKDPDTIYGGRVDALDLRTNQTRTLDPPIAFPDHYRATWTLPLVFSPRDPTQLYFAHQRLFRTSNGGRTWKILSPDLTRETPGTLANLDAVTAAHDGGVGPRRGVIFAIAPSPAADRDVWVGTDDGLVWRSTDDGAHWKNLTPPEIGPWSKIASLEVSRFDAQTAYAAVDRHRLDDFAPHVYRTRDGGKRWSEIDAGLPTGAFVNVVREDPARRGLLYAGTERGVAVSLDAGGHWQRLQLDLPVTSVRDLTVHGDDLIIATHGRGFYILDDVAPLRQMSEEVARADAWLFTPSQAVRVRPPGFTGTPLPKDEAIAANPPPGAVIDYVLLRAPAGPVTLSILDKAGALVRRYSSDDQPPPPRGQDKRLAPEWVVTPHVLSAAPGMHRYVWPFRHAAATALAKDAGGWIADGVWAPPGRYTVEFAVDGRKLTRPLTVVPDPRVQLAPDAYRRQFGLARRVEKARAALAAAQAEVAAAHKSLQKRAPDPEAAALDAELQAIAEIAEPDLRAVRGPPKSLASFPFLDQALEKLAAAIDGADVDPSPDARTGLEQTERTLAATLAAWEKIQARLPR